MQFSLHHKCNGYLSILKPYSLFGYSIYFVENIWDLANACIKILIIYNEFNFLRQLKVAFGHYPIASLSSSIGHGIITSAQIKLEVIEFMYILIQIWEGSSGVLYL